MGPSTSLRRIAAVVACVCALFGALVLPARAAAEADTVYAFGDAPALGGTGTAALAKPLVDIEATADGAGYWIFGGDGAVFARGTAGFFGSMGGRPINGPVVDGEPTPSDNGYWMVSGTGGVFTFGDAGFYGSTGNMLLPRPVVAIEGTASGMGYWIVTAGGGIYSFGDAASLPVLSPQVLGTASVVAFDTTSAGDGYWMTLSDGRIVEHGSAAAFEDSGLTDAVAFSVTPDEAGAYVVNRAGAVVAVGAATLADDVVTGRDVVAIASSATGDGYWVATSGPRPGVITGKVTNSASEPLGGICVTATGNGFPWQQLTTKTAADGTYRLEPTADGAFRIEFVDCATGTYLREFFDDATDYGAATLVTTQPEETSVANATLIKGGSFTGVVTDEAGNVLQGMCVTAVRPWDQFMYGDYHHAITTSTGFYRVNGIRPGKVDVRFGDCTGESKYLGEHYDDQDFPALATKLDIASGVELTNIDADLRRAGRITGVLTGPAGEKVQGQCVEAYDENAHPVASAYSTSTGYYVLGGLRSGSYKVAVRDCYGGMNVSRYAHEWVPNAVTPDGAEAIGVTQGEDVQRDVPLEAPSRINGVITRESDGSPLANGVGCVSVFAGEQQIAQTVTSSTGFYSVGGLRAAPYEVNLRSCFNSAGLAGEWWNDSPTRAGATEVNVPAANIAHNVNAALAPGGSLEGVVTGPNGAPVEWACVQAVGPEGSFVGYTFTSNTGYYRLNGLTAGPHKVQFNGCGLTQYALEWWDDQPTQDLATPVTVTSGTVRSGINASLQKAGSISGVVTDSSGAAVQGVCIAGVPAGSTGDTFSSLYGYTSSTGYYRLDRALPGSYKVEFDTCGYGANEQWWQGATSAAGATPVTVGADATTTGIDAQLVLGVAAPASVSAAGGDRQALVSWTSPSPTPSRQIVGFEVRAVPDGPAMTVAATERQAVVSGLTNGQPYVFSVRTLFADGRGAARASAPVTPGAAPLAPQSVVAAAGNGTANVSWGAPASDNGSPVTGYIVTASPGGAQQALAASARSASFTGLANGTRYTFSVRAVNAHGPGAAATSNAVTPTGPPAAPQNATASAGDGVATVTWTPPASNGGLDITGYTVTASPSGGTQTVSGTSATFTGLTNGTTYSFAISATNAAGQGPSTSSNSVTPSAPPPNPSQPAVEVGAEAAPATPVEGQLLVEGSGFAPFSEVAIELHSTPILLKKVTTDRDGSFRTLVTIPASAEVGTHTLVANGVTSSGAVRQLRSPIVVVSDLADDGYWLVAGDGGVFSYGAARFFGSTGAMTLNRPIVGMAATPTGNGYWMVASDGGIFSFGDARFFGSTGAMTLNKPIVGMAATPTGNGYWLVASDGGIFSFGDAAFLGSTGAIRLNRPIVGMTASPTGKGYWLVASDGGIFAFGDALFRGSTGAILLNSPIVGMASSRSGAGYWLVASDGGVFTFGDAPYLGSQAGRALSTYASLRPTPSGNGYRLVDTVGRVAVFGDARFLGDASTVALSKPVLGMTP